MPNELEFSFLKINMELFNVVIIQHVVFITNLQQNLFPTYGVVDLILKRPVKWQEGLSQLYKLKEMACCTQG